MLCGVLLYKNHKHKLKLRLEMEEKTVLTLRDQTRHLSNQLVHNRASKIESEIMTSFKEKASNHRLVTTTEKDWSQLILFVNNHYPGFMDEIYRLYPKIKEIDIRIAHLIKMGFSNTEIENITKLPHTTSYRHIIIIKNKLASIL